MSPETIQAIETPRRARFFNDNPPHQDAIRMAQRIFDNAGGNETPPVIRCERPIKVLLKSSKIMSKIRIKGVDNESCARELFQFFVQHGAIIETNDLNRKFVFDKDRFRELCLVHRNGILSLDQYDRQERLLELLGITTKPEVDLTLVTPHPAAPKANPQLLWSDEVRQFVKIAASEELNGMIATYPEISDMPDLLGLLAVHSAKGHESAILETLEDLFRGLHRLRDHFDADAMEVIESFRPDAPAPIAGQITQQQIEVLIRQLLDTKKPLDAEHDRISRFRQDASEQLEHIQVQVIQQSLSQRLTVAQRSQATKHEVPLLETALNRAEMAASALESYLDELADILRPIKAQLEIINRRIMALRLVGQTFQPAPIESRQLPEQPVIDVSSLEDWQSIQIEIQPQAEVSSTPTPDPVDNIEEKTSTPEIDEELRLYNEKLVLAVYALVGRTTHRTAFKVARMMHGLGLLAPEVNTCVGIVLGSCTRLSKIKDQPMLIWCGTVLGKYHCYRATEHLPQQLVDEMLTPEQQESLIEAFKKQK